MSEDHSTQKGKIPLVVSAKMETGFDGNGSPVHVSLVQLEIPSDFDFTKRGDELLRNIVSAHNLFFEKEI